MAIHYIFVADPRVSMFVVVQKGRRYSVNVWILIPPNTTITTTTNTGTTIHVIHKRGNSTYVIAAVKGEGGRRDVMMM